MSPCSSDVKDKSYQTLVRPQIEYNTQVKFGTRAQPPKSIDWEQVQRNAARFVFSDYRRETHVSPLVNKLNWDSGLAAY